MKAKIDSKANVTPAKVGITARSLKALRVQTHVKAKPIVKPGDRSTGSDK